MDALDTVTDVSEPESEVSGNPTRVDNAEARRVSARRGKYRRSTAAERSRVLAAAAADNGSGDWRAVALANGVSPSTAYGWLMKDGQPPKKRGGARQRKVTQEHLNQILGYVEANPLITLKEMSNKLFADTGLRVSTTTIHAHLEGQLYTIKKVHAEPATMNSDENRRRRAAYVTSLMEATGDGKYIIYIDECNVNLFLRRFAGRSKKGSRCSIKLPTCRGKNVHVIGAISQRGLVYLERRRGSYTKEESREWTRRMLRAAQEPYDNVLVVCDNAPCHAGLEEVFMEEEFRGAQLLRLAPYSAPLNPIEEVWSTMKADMKRQLAEAMPQLLREPTPEGLTQAEHRLRRLEATIDLSVERVTPMLCMRVCNHVQRHFAACIALRDLAMGDIPAN